MPVGQHEPLVEAVRAAGLEDDRRPIRGGLDERVEGRRGVARSGRVDGGRDRDGGGHYRRADRR